MFYIQLNGLSSSISIVTCIKIKLSIRYLSCHPLCKIFEPLIKEQNNNQANFLVQAEQQYMVV